MGTNLQACRDALTSKAGDHLHLLERTNIDLQIQNSIVPSALSLTRFKVSGKLPSLHVNLSDTKYKTLMRLIDVTIPQFGEESERRHKPKPSPPYIDTEPIVLPLSAGLFSPTGLEYNVDDNQSEAEHASTNRDDVFFEASDGTSEVIDIVIYCLSLTDICNRIRNSGNTSSNWISRSTICVHQFHVQDQMGARSRLDMSPSNTFGLA